MMKRVVARSYYQLVSESTNLKKSHMENHKLHGKRIPCSTRRRSSFTGDSGSTASVTQLERGGLSSYLVIVWRHGEGEPGLETVFTGSGAVLRIHAWRRMMNRRLIETFSRGLCQHDLGNDLRNSSQETCVKDHQVYKRYTRLWLVFFFIHFWITCFLLWRWLWKIQLW